jgi:hypothetical protein
MGSCLRVPSSARNAGSRAIPNPPGENRRCALKPEARRRESIVSRDPGAGWAVDGSLWPGGLGLAPGRSAIARGTAAVDSEMILLEAVRAPVRQSDRLVRRLGSGDERVRWVRSIPGVGPFFAVRIVNEIGDVTRFARPANLCGYAGLVPAVYASGGRVFHGRLTKQGNRWLRWALVESRAPRSEDGSGTARRLLTIVPRVLSQARPPGRREWRVILEVAHGHDRLDRERRTSGRRIWQQLS